ncbi:MAG TPA: M20/M25/M40 family metallo-hydrolase, partial [Candidatus Gracilibacteria bacterium]|nr:M20/M25/M40 family metallo-hydrolase [Candidatus Gracilibacteria bacterium]
MELLSDLIKIKSWAENSQGLEEVINLVEKYLQKNISGLYLKKFLHKGKPSLVASFYDTKEFDLILNGHLDVVPGSAEIFNLKTEENLLKGRGVYDMKMGGYMMIKVMQELQAQKPNIALMLTTDEEVGGENGVRYLLEQEKYRAKVVFIPDGSSGLDYLGKGIINLKVATKGISAHSAYPWRGENALDKLLKAIQQI